jgi:L-lactate utilization protein LutB
VPSRNRTKVQNNRSNLLSYKKTLSCIRCGIKDHRVLEFHHINEKDKAISSLVSQGYSWKRIEEEINKCIPLCCNCHRLEHWND